MDHGRIIAQGSPVALLAAHFDESILVLPPDQAPALARAELAAQETLHGLELATRAVNETLRRLLDAGADLSGLRIRTATLEDLFLELTGKELRA
jgi:ABC-2 type transport system ATP-binding protein